MRRWLFTVAALAGLMCGLTGCYHTAGVCDCDIDPDPCLKCAPWLHGAHVVDPHLHVPVPNGHHHNGHHHHTPGNGL